MTDNPSQIPDEKDCDNLGVSPLKVHLDILNASDSLNDPPKPRGPIRIEPIIDIKVKDDDNIRCVTIGDPHFKVSNVQESTKMVENCLEKCKEYEPDFIVVLGDVLDTHERIHVMPLTLANDFLLKLTYIAPTFLIIGNHDRPNNSDFLTGYHPFLALKEWDNMYVADTTLEAIIGKYRFLFVPYVHTGRFMEALEVRNSPLSNTKCIFAHQEFRGAKMGAILSEKGDPWPLSNPLVVSGHIHDFQELEKNLIYTGTPMQHAFGDTSDKTISIFTFNNSGYNHQRTGLNLIKRITRTITVQEVYTYEPPTNVLLRLNIKGTAPDIKSIEKLDKIKEWQNAGIKVNFSFISENSNTDDINIVNRSFKEELEDAIKDDPLQVAVYKELFVTFDNNKNDFVISNNSNINKPKFNITSGNAPIKPKNINTQPKISIPRFNIVN